MAEYSCSLIPTVKLMKLHVTIRNKSCDSRMPLLITPVCFVTQCLGGGGGGGWWLTKLALAINIAVINVVATSDTHIILHVVP